MSGLVPIKIVKVSSNDTVPLIYLPKEVRKRLDLEKGDKVILYVNLNGSRLVLEKISREVDDNILVGELKSRHGSSHAESRRKVLQTEVTGHKP